MTLRDRCAGLAAALQRQPSYHDRLRMLIERHVPGSSADEGDERARFGYQSELAA